MVRWCGLASVTPSVAVSACIVIQHFPHKAQHTAHYVPDNYLARLGCREPTADLAYALDEPRSVAAFELANNAEHQRGGGNGAWSRVADLSALKKTV
jgi:hypothetical protein